MVITLKQIVESCEEVVKLLELSYIDSIGLNINLNSDTIIPTKNELESLGFVENPEALCYTLESEFFEPMENSEGSIELVAIHLHINYHYS